MNKQQELLEAWLSEGKYFDPDLVEFDRGKKLTIFTALHKYSISFDEEYMGCIAQCRKPYRGEKHLRGSDLADGEFCRETFEQIIFDIVSHELVHPKSRARVPVGVGGQGDRGKP
jgi:hypothetical protein